MTGRRCGERVKTLIDFHRSGGPVFALSPHRRPVIRSFALSPLNFWLIKSEPDTYGWHHFTEQGRAIWDGVRNYQARNNLNAMRLGDQVLFYHSVTNPGVIGLATVVREAYPDPTAPDESNATSAKRWVVVELEPVMMLETPVPLARIKAEPLLANVGLIKQSRLSVMPIRPDEFELILKMGQQVVKSEE